MKSKRKSRKQTKTISNDDSYTKLCETYKWVIRIGDNYLRGTSCAETLAAGKREIVNKTITSLIKNRNNNFHFIFVR